MLIDNQDHIGYYGAIIEERKKKMENMIKRITFRIPAPSDDRWKSWRKWVIGVDKAKTNGYAFEGQFLRKEGLEEAPVGSIILLYDEEGSVRNHEPSVRAARLMADGELQIFAKAVGWDWALRIRDKIAEALTDKRSQLEEERVWLLNRLKEVEAELASF